LVDWTKSLINLAPRAGLPGACGANGLAWLTSPKARIGAIRGSVALANRHSSSSQQGLALYDEASRALAEVHRIDEVKRRLASDVHQVVFAPVGEHSANPAEVRHRIERLVGGPYLELYGRRPADGSVDQKRLLAGQAPADTGAQ